MATLFFILLLCFPTSKFCYLFLFSLSINEKKMSLSNEFYFIFLSMFHLVLQGLFFLGKTHLGNNHEPACLFWLSVMMNSTNKGLVQSVCLYLCVIVVSHQPPPVRSLCWDEENPNMANWTERQGNEVACKGHILLEISVGKDIIVS